MSRKCFNSHIVDMLVLSENGLELMGKPIEFVWVQGVITFLHRESQQLCIDDGTRPLMVIASIEQVSSLKVGEYVLVQGSIAKGEDEVSGNSMVALEARIVSPIKDPNMETLWFLEVAEAFSRSYG
jgi:hypothetical protein